MVTSPEKKKLMWKIIRRILIEDNWVSWALKGRQQTWVVSVLLVNGCYGRLLRLAPPSTSTLSSIYNWKNWLIALIACKYVALRQESAITLANYYLILLLGIKIREPNFYLASSWFLSLVITFQFEEYLWITCSCFWRFSKHRNRYIIEVYGRVNWAEDLLGCLVFKIFGL